MAIDFMGVLRRCTRCKSPDEDVCWSEQLTMYCCDACYEDIIYGDRNEAQSSSSTSSTR